MEKSVLTAREAAAILRVSVSTMYKLLRSNTVPNIQIGQRRVIPTAQFMRWLELSTKGGTI